jgi:hypothetical protein
VNKIQFLEILLGRMKMFFSIYLMLEEPQYSMYSLCPLDLDALEFLDRFSEWQKGTACMSS